MYRFCSVIIISIYNKSMPNKKDINWNTEKLRRFDFNNFGLSIDPLYDGKDPFAFKAGSQHLHTKLSFTARKHKRIG